MALTGSFTDLLMTAKRRAQLSGRPLTSRETSGIAEGYAATATDRLIRMKTLEERKRRTDAELKAADEAKEREKRGTIGAGVGGLAGYALAGTLGVTGPVGFIGGMMVGEMLGGTWLCTETKKHSGLTDEQTKTLDKFRAYAKEHHPGWLEFYIRIGPEIVKAINETEGQSFYDNLKESMIEPVIAFFDNDRKEDAFIAYKLYVIACIKEYTPQHIKEAEAVDKVDLGLKEAA